MAAERRVRHRLDTRVTSPYQLVVGSREPGLVLAPCRSPLDRGNDISNHLPVCRTSGQDRPAFHANGGCPRLILP